ncbi:MAG TPA: alpha/beta fold hydrolase, partial [Kofleriaceae bacterium]
DAPPRYATTPFPTDALRDGDHLATITGLDKLVVRYSDLVAAHVAALDGFGVRPLVEFFLDGDADPATLTSDTAGVVDPDGHAIVMDWNYDTDRRVLQGSPASGQVLREGTRYTAYVTRGVHDTSGRELQRSSELDAIVRSPAARWRSTAEAFRTLQRDDVVGLAVFTTQHATAPLVAARDAMASQPAPVLGFADPAIIFRGAALDSLLGVATRATDGPRAGLERWGNGNPTGMAHDHVGVVGTGTITVVRFRRDATGTHGPEDKTFELDAGGTPQVVALDQIPITFILPSAPPPPAGYPVVIYGHGLGASRDQLLGFAEPLTSKGFAIVGIDMVGHGSRFNPSDTIDNFSQYLPQFSGDPALRDGFGDTTGLATEFDFFESFLGVSAIRDTIRQSALDLVRVSQLVHRGDLDLSALGPSAKLDPTHVAYMGESFGTVVGTVFAAIEPDIDLFVLDVPGGGIVDHLLPDSAEIGSLALPLIESIYNPQLPLDRWNPQIGLMQAVIDGADPLTYAPHVMSDRFANVGPRSVVCLEVVGDQVLSNIGTDALAQELGLDVLLPDLAPPSGLAELASPAAGNRDGTTAILVQYAPATHGANWSNEHGTLKYMPGFPFPGDERFPKLPAPITITNPIYDTLDQVFEILATHQAGESPRVHSTRAPIADFDGDGVPDDQDPAPYDPSH